MAPLVRRPAPRKEGMRPSRLQLRGESKGFRGFMLALAHDEVLFRSAQVPEASLCLCTA